MVDILHEQHEGDTHFALTRLSSSCDTWWHGHEGVHVKQTPVSIRLVRFSEGKKSKHFEMSAQEFDALVAARQAFLNDIGERKVAEQVRIADEIEQAKALVASVICDKRPWALEHNERVDRWTLVCLHPTLEGEYRSETLIYPMQPHQVLSTVKAYLVQKKLIEPDPDATDDFDPFLDGDDLP